MSDSTPASIPVTRSRLPVVAIAVWAAILAAIIAISLLFGGRGPATGSDSTLGAGSDPGANAIGLTAPLAADPSASPGAGASTAPGTTKDEGGRKGPGGFAFGPAFKFGGGPGGPGGPGKGRGPISITAINGTQLSLKTDDGWTRTIDATGATITEAGGTAITLGDLKVGDQIGFKQTRNTDGTYKITAIARIPPQTGGTVKSVDATSATITLPDGTTKTIGLTSATTYSLKKAAATIADLKVGTRIHAVGTVDGSGNFTATKIQIEPASVAGVVTAKTTNTITITTKGSTAATVTITVSSSTTYQTRGNNAATIADIAVGNIVEAEGTLNSDGSLTATNIRFGAAGVGGFGPGKGGRGPEKHVKPANPANPNASPAPSANAG